MARIKHNRKIKRQDKVERCFTPAPPLRAKNKTQQEYVEAIENYPITIATGYPGTGKTYIPARLAVAALKSNCIKSIVLSRPNISVSNSLGYFKGTKDEKMLNWLAPVLSAFRESLAPSDLQYCIKEDVARITFCPLEVIKGVSWKNSFIIIDEAEDCTFKELRSICTRIGNNSTLVLCGDIDQCDLNHSGLAELINLLNHDQQMQAHVKHIEFNDINTIVRSETCKQMVLSFQRYQQL
jgi:phosphate starvation-inducible PhoH-like protein